MLTLCKRQHTTTVRRTCLCTSGALPIDAPAAAGRGDPHQRLGGGGASMMVQGRGALVKTASMPGVAKLEALKIEVVAEFVAKGTEECAEGGDVLADRGSHPDTDEQVGGVIVAEKLGGGVIADSEGSSGEDADGAFGHLVKFRGSAQESRAGSGYLRRRAGLHGGLDRMAKSDELRIGRKREGFGAVAEREELAIFLSGRRIG